MEITTRIPPKIALLAVSLAYFAIGYSVLSWFQYEPDLAAVLTPLLMGFPIFLFMATWKGIEIYWGRRIIERINPSDDLRTLAQTRVERRASALTVGFALFVGLAPISISILNGDGVSFSSLSPAIVWAWLLHTFGLNRMRFAVIMMTSGSAGTPRDVAEVLAFAPGLIVSKAKDPTGTWVAQYDKTIHESVPRIVLTARKKEDDGEVVELNDDEQIALLGLLTGDGNPYRLAYGLNLAADIDLDALTAHEKIEAAGAYMAALARVPELRAS